MADTVNSILRLPFYVRRGLIPKSTHFIYIFELMAEKEEEQQSTCVNDTKSFLWTSFSFLLTDIIQCKGISTVSFPNILKSTQLHYLLFYNDVRMYRFYHFTSHISFNSNSSPYPLQHSLLSYKVQYFFSVHPFIPAALYPSIPDGVWFVSNECTGNVSTPTQACFKSEVCGGW